MKLFQNISGFDCQLIQRCFHLNWNNAPWWFPMCALLYEHTDIVRGKMGMMSKVIVVKQICKCLTIAFRVMVCLWISRVIVPLQLGYLHNQLSGLAIMYFPLFAAVFSLQLARCPIELLVYAHLLYVCMYSGHYATFQGLIKSTHNSFPRILYGWRSQDIVPYVYINIITRHVYAFYIVYSWLHRT